ncbi:integrase family protein [Paraglaciecola sp. MB-3u-78]|uniref:integrase family protein n=1 Tax=Paraglaciecola sp. MB-3u-78 TaxID=2058332 RepID=UPI001E6095BC|nr:integrase family protein [Paraglaciecola sp. MB-3u-78]
MADNRFKFTLRRIEKIEPSAKRDRYYDTENAGLILEVQPSGRKVFRTFKRNSTSGNLYTVSKTLGHKSNTTTQKIYALAAQLGLLPPSNTETPLSVLKGQTRFARLAAIVQLGYHCEFRLIRKNQYEELINFRFGM